MSSAATRIQLTERSFVDHFVGWRGPDAAARLFAALRAGIEWEHREIVLFGKRVLQPRLVGWGGDLPYRYSGQTLEPRPLHAAAASVVRDVSRLAGVPFNHVLFNLYRDGNDSMGFHADDEPELGRSPCVASLSLGEPRRFVLKTRRGKHSAEVVLGHGDLLVMCGDCQEEVVHGVPRQRTVVGERLSLTFRRVLGEKPALAPTPRRG